MVRDKLGLCAIKFQFLDSCYLTWLKKKWPLTHWHLELFAKIVFFFLHFGGFEAGSRPN